jgi:Na+-transporting methylmalonyl-CoA/oxaloacetate decarboxylase gamma subunit
MIRVFLFILVLFMFKAGRAINKFDISENISHSPKQAKNFKKEIGND